MPGFTVLPLVLALLLGATFAAGCGGKQQTDEVTAELPLRARNGNLPAGNGGASSADVNFDGTPDQYEFFENGRIVWARRDLDFDGQPDLFEYYDANGLLLEQEFQLDYDPSIDAVRYYQGGVLIRKDFSTGYDGVFTLFKYYDADGTLLRIERDNDVDGNIDTWEYYEGGRLRRIGRDVDGDGTPEVIEDAS